MVSPETTVAADPARPPRAEPPFPIRILHAWRALPREQRLAALGAVGLFCSLFLPWYEETRFFADAKVTGVVHATVTHSAISHFTFIEAAELLTVAGVLGLLFMRGESRAFHLPGGDGTIITAAGVWSLLLVVWRFFDKPNFGSNATAGLHWGVLGPLIASAAIIYAGLRIRAAHRPEPALPGERSGVSRLRRRRAPAAPPAEPTSLEGAIASAAASEQEATRTTSLPRATPAPPTAPPTPEPPTAPATEVSPTAPATEVSPEPESARPRRAALPFEDVPTPAEPPDAPDQLTIPLGEPYPDERDS